MEKARGGGVEPRREVPARGAGDGGGGGGHGWHRSRALSLGGSPEPGTDVSRACGFWAPARLSLTRLVHTAHFSNPSGARTARALTSHRNVWVRALFSS